MKQARSPFCRALCMILTIVMVMSMLPATVWAADGTTLYLKPNSNWTQANARFAIYCYGNGEKWVDMSDTDGDGLYEGTVPAGYPNVIFCRMNPSTDANNWDNKWNQTADLTVPTNGTNCYTVADGTWDSGGGTWSTFTPVTEEPEPEPDPEEPEEPEVTESITVYFRNDWLWSSVNAHYWDDPSGQGTNWPGEQMTKVDTVDGYDVYSIEIPTWATGLIFNGNSQQTPNITDFADGDAYYIHWDGENKASKFDYTPSSGEEPEPDPEEPEVPEVTEATYIIAGNNAAVFGTAWDPSNTANKMTLNGDGKYEKTYESVAIGTYSFKVTDGTWTNAWGGTGEDGNYEFTLNAISDVTITFDGSSKEITVTSTPTGEVAEPVTAVTIHYRNTGLWSNVHAYGWLAGTETTINGGWPGAKVTENAEHKNWYTVELTELNAPSGIGILFTNNSGGQTGDIMITENGEYWYDGELLTAAPDTWADGSVAMVSYQATLHFADAKNWGCAYLYAWTNLGSATGSWPGTALAQGEDGFYSMTVSYEAPAGHGLSFIFSGSGQTVDLALDAGAFTETDGVYTAEKWVVATSADTEGKFYADIVDAPEAIAISPKQDGNTVTFQYKAPSAGSVSVAGTMNNWAPAAMSKNAYGVWSVTLEDVAYGLHQYKFIVDDTWLLDPLNTWIYTEENGNQNSAFLISDPSLDNNSIKIKVHYDAPTTEWNVCAWGAKDLAPQYNFTNGVTTITLDGRANQYVAFKVRKSVAGNDWAEQSGEIRVDLANIVSGTIDVWVGSGFSVSQSLNADVVYANKVKSVELNYDNNTIVIQTVKAVSDAQSAFAIYKNGELAEIIEEITVSGGSTILSLTEDLELVDLYRYKIAFLEDINAAYQGGIHIIGTNTVYASDKFAEEFTYNGELGALWSEDSTTFRVWAPTAAAVTLNLYTSGTENTDDLIEAVTMTAGEDGTWVATVERDLNGTYYTYTVNVDGQDAKDVVDPYARTTGVNGKRGMVIDLDSTDPEGWDEDRNPNPIEKYSDAIIYELHVRDFSIDDSSGVSEANRGKYLAFTEKGTTTQGGATTGIDYLEDLGITHLHLLPVYDYGSVDETKCENFNWGYDPVNYNTPEGSYSTDPYNGEVRVKEFKKMVMALHEADISVIMDVVYNHVYDAGKFNMNQIVPKYFSRVNADGSYSNGSGCGNDTASEREMVRKYIVESVLYWHQEYHIDGFRFDLVGLLDATTINQIVDEVHKCCPDVIFYGEGWDMTTAVEPGNGMATQSNSSETPDFAYFSDTIRNLLAGSNGHSLGFVSGLTGQEESIANNFMAKPHWTKDPQQIVQYASCHDNYTLIDKLILSTGKSGIDADIIKMNNLAAAIYMTSQGIAFIHAGEEFLREKLEEDGGRCENSYNASDFVNHIEWSDLDNATYAANSAYYKGLIEFRKAHESLRLETRAEIDQYVDYTWVTNEVVMFQIDAASADDISDSIIVIFNATNKAAEVTLPAGQWSICVNNTTAGTEVLGTAESTVSVAGISAMVLVQGETEIHEHDWSYTVNDDGTHTATCDCDETVTESHTYEDGQCVCGEKEPVVEVETITIYFQNNWLWTEIKAYFWIGDQPQSASWPGDDMTWFGNDGDYDIYSIEVPANITGLIINGVKDDGSGSLDQTPDITSGWYDGICYYMQWNDGNQVGSEDISVVLPAPEPEVGIITKQPVSVEDAILNETYTFTVEATGENLSYLWQLSTDGGETWEQCWLDGYNTDTLTIKMLQFRDGYTLRCVVSGADVEETSKNAVLKLKETNVTITQQPVSVEDAILNETYAFTVAATGENLSYLWELSTDSGNTWAQCWLDGYNTDTLSVTMAQYRNGYTFRCVVSSMGKKATTNSAVLKLKETDVEITQQPVSVENAILNETYTFTLEATGDNLSYLWQLSTDGGETWTQCWLSGYNTDTLTVTMAQYRNGYTFRCVVSSMGKQVTSQTAVLKLEEAELAIVTQPQDVALPLNGQAVFTVEATGTGLSYRWYLSADGGDTWDQCWLDGYNTQTLSFVAIASRAAKVFKCVVTDIHGNEVTTNIVRVNLE